MTKNIWATIDHPAPGWVFRKLHCLTALDEKDVWRLELIREKDGYTVITEADTAHLTFIRGIERAHMLDNDLAELPPVEGPTHRYGALAEED